MGKQSFKTLLAIMLLAALTVGCVFGFRVMRADLLYFNIERELVFWGSNERQPTAAELADALQRIDRALQYWPDNADYLVMKARILIWHGVIAGDTQVADGHFKQALAVMERALAVRPSNPYSWALYAEYLTTQPDRGGDLTAAVAKVRLLGPGDPNLQKRMQAISPR
jgi:tetratricopeptide (TPR) repeat protein